MPRLDQMLVDRGLFASREQARRAVMAGEVLVDGQRRDKPGRR
jgi:23S rRNA (cytidine1920-2'-O)/16S rRNA (cytidine1409-2'-O)-methyltransferase